MNEATLHFVPRVVRASKMLESGTPVATRRCSDFSVKCVPFHIMQDVSSKTLCVR